MNKAKLPLLFVVSVAGLLAASGLVLAATAAWPTNSAHAPALGATAVRPPTGSSITASYRPLPAAPGSIAPSPAQQPPPAPATPSRAARQPQPTGRGTPMTVSYSVAGPGTAAILTYWRSDHDIASEHEVALPWSRTVVLTEPRRIRLSAQTGLGEARCAIAVDGQVVAEASGASFVSCEAALRPAVHDR